ncbi:MAG TPA: beta-galactosidase trimerization domain-containing protein, partial [Phycisphaerae bacterium]|nr:beta-galactosidase trimerization domain-containing protein [Phycisphaerae bacterium]
WLAEFAQAITEHIKKVKPGITVTHQFSPVLAGWLLGQSAGIAAASDYPSGDFYGGKNQHRLGVKVFNAFRHNDMPLEFMTSRCVDLWDHTSMKSEEELFCSAVTTLAHGGAYFFIDAINPDGTLEPSVYERLGKVSALAKPFTDIIKKLRPEIQAEVGLYFSMESNDDARLNGTPLIEFSPKANNMEGERFVPVIKEILGTAVVLGECNIPYKIVTPESKLDGLSTIIVNNAKYMSVDEVQRLRRFVYGGGTLIVTGRTSFCDMLGNSKGDFALADVLGVSYAGRKTPRISYLHDENGHIVSTEPAPLVHATAAKSLAKVSLPYFDPDDTEHYASIHSNPPGDVTEYDALTINNFGSGRCIYLYSSLLGIQHDVHQKFGKKLFGEYIRQDVIDSDAPGCVAITLLSSKVDDKKLLLCFVNWQEELPNIPVHNISATITLPGNAVCSNCCSVSGTNEVDWRIDGGRLTVKIPRLETAEFIEITLK